MTRPAGPTRRMPQAQAVDRIQYLTSAARGKRVIHLGFAGEGRGTVEQLVVQPTWLHGALASAASSLVGVEQDPEAVERARALGFEVYCADASDGDSLRRLAIEPADLVIAGELIEHLERPGALLDAMHGLVAPEGLLVVTTPNAASILNPLAAIARIELINPDHVAFYSWFTLTNLLRRHDWDVKDFATYHFSLAGEAWTGGGAARLGRIAARLQGTMARVWPYIDFGLIAAARSTRTSFVETPA